MAMTWASIEIRDRRHPSSTRSSQRHATWAGGESSPVTRSRQGQVVALITLADASHRKAREGLGTCWSSSRKPYGLRMQDLDIIGEAVE